MLGGSSGILYTINAEAKIILEAWNIGEEIVAFDCYESQNIGLIIVAATISNKIYFRNNLI